MNRKPQSIKQKNSKNLLKNKNYMKVELNMQNKVLIEPKSIHTPTFSETGRPMSPKLKTILF